MRAFAMVLFLAVLALVPAPASAVTVDQVVALAKAGVTDAVILALIERDRTILSIEPEQLVALKRDGLSEAVIIAMLKSGRAEGEEAARAESEYRNAFIAASLAPAPEVLFIGHGPDRPNTAHYDGFFSERAPVYFTSPYFNPAFDPGFSSSYAAPFAQPYRRTYRASRFAPREDWRLDPFTVSERQRVEPPALCYAQVASGPSRSNSLTFVTECPQVMQRSLKRQSR